MQRSFTIVILALTLSNAVADYYVNSAGWAKAPVSVCADDDRNFTNTTTLSLGGMSTSDVSVFAYDMAVISYYDKNVSSAQWSLWTKTLDSKTLSSTPGGNYFFRAPLRSFIAYGYAMGFEISNDTNNIPQMYLYQTKLSDGSNLPRVTLTSNRNANYTPMFVGLASNEKTLFFFYAATITKVNFTSLTIGGYITGREYTLTTSFNATVGSLSAATGKALTFSQVYVGWTEGYSWYQVYKVAVIDLSTGALSGFAQLGNYNSNYTCSPYVTDEKIYGIWCKNSYYGTTEVYASANSTNLLKMFTANSTTQRITGVFPYAGHLGFFYVNSANYDATVLSYEIWDVENFKTVKNKTDYLTYNSSTSAQTQYRVPSGGIYSLLWNRPRNYSDPFSTKTKVQVGLLIDPPAPSNSSFFYLVIGIIMVIVGGFIILFNTPFSY